MARLRNITTIDGSGGNPPGVVIAFAGTTAPTGWLLCDGSAVDRTTYAALYDAINTIHGAGDGFTTFNLPDLRQRFPIGKANSGTASTLGTSGGQIDHNHSVPAHHHALGTGADLNITSSGTHTTALDHTHSSFSSDAGTAHSHANTLATGAGTAHSHSLSGLTINAATTGLTVVTFSGSSGLESADHAHGVSATTGTESADHSHSGTTSTVSNDHAHAFSGTTSNDSHTHTVPTSSGGSAVGSGSGGHPDKNSGGSTGTCSVNSDAHSHTYSGTTGGINANHTHTFTSGGRSAAHTHSFSTTSGGVNANHSHVITHGHSVSDPGHGHTASGTVANESAHTHPITGGITNESAHTHPVNIPAFTANSASTGVHTHGSGNFTGRIGLVTGGQDGNAAMTSGNTNPPYYVLHFIIKT